MYNELGQRSTLTQDTSKTVSYGYDSLYRLHTLAIDLASASADLNLTFGYNAAGQITSRTADNDLYAQAAPGGRIAGTYTPDVLNRYTKVAGVNQTYDPKGNLTGDGTNSFTYDNENRLTKIGAATTLTYDPADRLSRKAGSSDDIRYVYDGSDLIEEYDASTGNVLRKYVHGPGVDEPMVWYEGADLTDRRWMTADERGSIIAATTAPGGVMNINTYDEYGAPGPNNIGRFGYTGQTWLSEGGIYNYKARAYSPKLGRFMQTDPIGYADNMNPYAYVGNDPANLVDASGLAQTFHEPIGTLTVTLRRENDTFAASLDTTRDASGTRNNQGEAGGGSGDGSHNPSDELVVTGHRNPPPPPAPKVTYSIGIAWIQIHSATVFGFLPGELNIPVPWPQANVHYNVPPNSDDNSKQKNGRPSTNTAQNKQVSDAAKQAGLDIEEWEQLSDEVETLSRQHGQNLGYKDILAIAREIKGH